MSVVTAKSAILRRIRECTRSTPPALSSLVGVPKLPLHTVPKLRQRCTPHARCSNFFKQHTPRTLSLRVVMCQTPPIYRLPVLGRRAEAEILFSARAKRALTGLKDYVKRKYIKSSEFKDDVMPNVLIDNSRNISFIPLSACQYCNKLYYCTLYIRTRETKTEELTSLKDANRNLDHALGVKPKSNRTIFV